MRRGVLINRSHRQHALVNSILGRQPLVAHLTRHQQLPQALGLPGLSSLPVSQAIPVSPPLTSTIPAFPTIDSNFQAAPFIQPEDDADVKVEDLPPVYQVYEASIPMQQEQPRVETPLQAATQEIRQHEATAQIAVHKPDETGHMHTRQQHEKDTANQLSTPARHQESVRSNVDADVRSIPPATGMEQQAERLYSPEQQAVASAEIPVFEPIKVELEGDVVPGGEAVAEAQALVTHEDRYETGMEAESKSLTGQQIERLTTDEAVSVRVAEGAKSPIETVRPRRSRRNIEELTTQRSPVAPTKKEPEGPQRAVQASKVNSQPDTKPGTRREDEVHADELFAPANTDRSPQAWLARLMGKSIPAQEEVVPGTETAPGRDLPAESRESEAPVDKGTAIPQPQQSSKHSPVVKAGPSEGHNNNGDLSQQSDPVYSRADPLQSAWEWGRAVPGMTDMAEAARTIQGRQPEQLSSRARRFLRPQVGIDPASVQIHRDSQATQLADAYSADAVTMAGTVELPTSNASETPETLGLLAHELTHVARQRQPGFLPPILQTQQDVGDGSGSYIVGPPLAGRQSGRLSEPGATADEEALALQVERQVRQVAREQVRQEGAVIPPASDPWSGLPAPWEPLPGWLTTPVPPTPAEQSVSSSPAPASMPALTLFEAQGMASNGGSQQANGTAETGVQRAGRERSIGEDAIPSAASSREARAPEPDLDELARQVYSILRNRLEVERRRHG